MIDTQGKLLLSSFMAILIGIVLIQPIGDDIELLKVSSRTITNESIAISSGAGTLANDEGISFDACRNTSDIMTANTLCNVTLATGIVAVDPTNFSDGLAFIDYKYEPDTYVHSSAARVIVTQTRLFFAIAILLVGIGFAIAAFKQSGVM